MKSNYKPIGEYIRQIKIKNTDGVDKQLLGINIDKYFMPSVANVVGTDLTKYKIVKKKQFACNRMHVGRDKRLPVALSDKEEDFIVSPAYDVFEITDKEVMLPEYLMMWFSRKEFDRNAWFYTDADVRGGLHWDAFCNIKLPVPSIEKQREIVKEYNTIVNRIKLNEALNKKLEETAQAIYRQWFVDFEFPCLPSDYRPHGQVNPKSNNDELISEINKVSTYKRVGGLPVPDGKSWFIYIIECGDGSFYKGITNDLYRRFYEHYTGQGADWTKVHKPLRVIHWEQFDSQKEAAKREKELKTGYGRTWLQRQYKKLINVKSTYSSSANKPGLPAPECKLRKAGKMVWNDELGKEIPEEWKDGKLSDLLEIKYGKDHKHLNDGTVPLFGSGGIMRYVEQSLHNEPSVLIPRKGSLDNILFISTPFWAVDTMFYSILLYEHIGQYVYHFLKTIDFYSLNVGSAVPSMTTEVLNNFIILIPQLNVITYFSNTLEKLFLKRETNINTNKKLIELESILLSKMAKG